MDSQIRLDWYRSNVIDNRWRQEQLPHGDAQVPADELPDFPDGDQGPSLTPKQQEKKWNDCGLASILAQAR